MARLTKVQKAIYEAHKAAFIAQDWTLKHVRDKAELIEQIRGGATCKALWDEIELRSNVSITSLISAAVLQQVSSRMNTEMKKGFQSWLTSVGIQ